MKTGIELIEAEDLERCENCEKELPEDQMLHDREGVPICPECYNEIKDDPEFHFCAECHYFQNEDICGEGSCGLHETLKCCDDAVCPGFKTKTSELL